jgi:uncharacterized protein YgfB (UPF0149 family)
MGRPTRRELEQENGELREALEDLYDRVGQLLGLDEARDNENDQVEDR